MGDREPLPIWPVHPRPLPDELLSSWMVRLAHANGFKTQTFYAFFFGRHAVAWNRDVDRALPVDVIDRLAHKAVLQPAALESMTLRGFNGLVYEDCSVTGNSPWLLSLGIRHRLRRNGGLQFCSACLAEDARPYFRRTWRMAWATACLPHGLLLRDRCPTCNEPVQFHRVDMTLRRRLPDDVSITVCANCGCDFAKLSNVPFAHAQVIDLQAQMETAATAGSVAFAGNPGLHSLAYFEGMRILASGIARLLKLPIGPGSLEGMDLVNRRSVMEHLARTVADWPKGFTDLTDSMPHPYAHFLKDRERSQVPHWLLEVADRSRRSSFSMSEQEREYICAVTEANTGRMSAARARTLFGRDLGSYLRALPVSDDDATMLVVSIDQSISVAQGHQRRDLLRDKVLFVTARVLGLSSTQVSNLEVGFADELSLNAVAEPSADVPRTREELGLWMRWYVKEVRPQYRSAHTPWLFLCETERGQASQSLISARFRAALTQSGISRRVGNFARWGRADT